MSHVVDVSRSYIHVSHLKKREIIAAILSGLTHILAEVAQATAALTGLKYEN